MNRKHIYEIGQTYGLKEIIAVNNENGVTKVTTRCVRCGAIRDMRPCALYEIRNQSCRCSGRKYQEEIDNTSRLYRTWSHMKHRCNNPNSASYPRYGGRGIKVCEEWYSYQNFAEWAISSGYTDELTIDRIDSNKGYSPDNCRWVTLSENVSFANVNQHRRANDGLYYGISPDGDTFVFENASKFASEHNLSAGCVRQCAAGAKKSHHGWTFSHDQSILHNNKEAVSTIESEQSQVEYVDGAIPPAEAHDIAR